MTPHISRPLRSIFLGIAVLTISLNISDRGSAQTASEYNKIVRAMEDDYQNAAQTPGRAARKQAYIDHAKRFVPQLEDFLKRHPDSKMAFDAKLNLAQVLQMAKEPARAKAIVDEAAAMVGSYAEIKRAAAVVKTVHMSTRAGWDVIAKNLDKVQSEPLRAKLHFELIKFIDVPKDLKGKKRKDQRNAYKRKKTLEVCETIAKGYPDTEEGRLSTLIIAGAKMGLGKPPVNLDSLMDIDERPVDLKAHKGKVILIHFWTAGSRRTYKKRREYLKELVKLGRDLKDKGFVIIGINVDYREDRERVDNMIGDTRMGWQTYLDGEKLYNRAALIYGVRKYPYSVLIGRDGNIASLDDGVNDIPDLVADLLGSK